MTPFVPLTDVLRAQVEAYQRLAWFLVACLEREYWLNLQALSGARATRR